jgi:hypothetical protein
MRELMATEGTARKRVTNDEVTHALRSLDDSIQKLEKVVLHPEKPQSGVPAKAGSAQDK